MYRACEVSVQRAYCERATQPYSLGGEVQFDRVVTTRSPRIVTECLLTRSILIKMYVHVNAILRHFKKKKKKKKNSIFNVDCLLSSLDVVSYATVYVVA